MKNRNIHSTEAAQNIVRVAVVLCLTVTVSILDLNCFAQESGKHFPRLAPHIGQLNRDGSFGPLFPFIGSGFDASVTTLILQPDGKMVLTGEFSNYDGQKVNHVVRLQQDGNLDHQFSLDPAFKASTIKCVVLQPDEKIVLAGDFKINENRDRHLLRLEANGALDRKFFQNTDPVKPSEPMTFREEEATLYKRYQILNNITTLHPDGKVVKTYVINRSPFGQFERIEGIQIQPDGKVLLTGFSHDNRCIIIRLKFDGSLDESFKSFSEPGDFLDEIQLLVQPNGKIIVGNSILTHQSPGSVSQILRLKPDGNLDPSFTKMTIEGGERRLLTMALQEDGKILVGGSFDTIQGIKFLNLIRLNQNGDVDEAFVKALGRGFDGRVRSIWIQKNGDILAGGDFRSCNGIATGSIARLHENGRVDESFIKNSAGGFNGSVLSLGVTRDDKIIVAGAFDSVANPKAAFPQWNKCNDSDQCKVIPGICGEWDIVNEAFVEDIAAYNARRNAVIDCEFLNIPKPKATCVNGVCTKKE